MKYKFMGKTVFFPEHGILAVGDLHIGYERMLKNAGLALPETQTEVIIKDLEEIFDEIKLSGEKVKKIVFLGDIKHHFGYEWSEKNYFGKVLDFLKEKKLKDSDIILIKGNHDKFDFSGKKMKNYWIKEGVAFLHGHLGFPEIYDEKVKMFVMGHLHPSVIISDKVGVKREKYKCFLSGNWKGKEVLITPSFFGIIEGSSVNEYNLRGLSERKNNSFSIISEKDLLGFNIHVVGEDRKVYGFGKVEDLKD